MHLAAFIAKDLAWRIPAGAGPLEHIPRLARSYLAVREVLGLKALEAIFDGELQAQNNSLQRNRIQKSGKWHIRDFFTQYVSRYYTRWLDYKAPPRGTCGLASAFRSGYSGSRLLY